MLICGVTNQGLELVQFSAVEYQRKREKNLHGDLHTHTHTHTHTHKTETVASETVLILTTCDTLRSSIIAQFLKYAGQDAIN